MEAMDELEFERSTHRTFNNLNLTPLIDVLFILIIFFMLTTTFMRIESLELILPSAGGKASSEPQVVHLYIHSGGEMSIGNRKVDQSALSESLKRMFEKDESTKIMLLSAEGVSMQQLVNVMDQVYMAGGKSLFVRKWENGAGKRVGG